MSSTPDLLTALRAASGTAPRTASRSSPLATLRGPSWRWRFFPTNGLSILDHLGTPECWDCSLLRPLRPFDQWWPTLARHVERPIWLERLSSLNARIEGFLARGRGLRLAHFTKGRWIRQCWHSAQGLFFVEGVGVFWPLINLGLISHARHKSPVTWWICPDPLAFRFDKDDCMVTSSRDTGTCRTLNTLNRC